MSIEGWALVKRGLYWRPDGKGYTGLKCEAGFYTDEQAMGYSDHGDGTTKVRWDEAPELSPSCSTETALKHFTSRALTAERLLAEAVEQAFRDGLAYGGNVENADPDVAWQHSKARATLSTGGVNG
jgi:hypothetical protein